MRTIRFRGIVDQERAMFNMGGKFVYGYLTKDFEGDYMIGTLTDTSNGVVYQYVIPETVGQFTGLKDKNGKEIYEGDVVKSFYYWEKDYIVKFGSYSNGEQWEDSRSGYGWFLQSIDEIESSVRELDYDLKSTEIIGNIHEAHE